jgi:hypothetical protein
LPTDETQFSVWYGQDYTPDNNYKYTIGGPYSIRSLKDVHKINFFTPVKDVAALFESLKTDNTEVYMHEVINIVFLLRTVVSNAPDGAQRQKRGPRGPLLRSKEWEAAAAEARQRIAARRVTRSQTAAQRVYQRRRGELLEFFPQLAGQGRSTAAEKASEQGNI